MVAAAGEVVFFVVTGSADPGEAFGDWLITTIFLFSASIVPGLLVSLAAPRLPGSRSWLQVIVAVVLLGIGATLIWRLLFMGELVAPNQIYGVILLGLPAWILFAIATRR